MCDTLNQPDDFPDESHSKTMPHSTDHPQIQDESIQPNTINFLPHAPESPPSSEASGRRHNKTPDSTKINGQTDGNSPIQNLPPISLQNDDTANEQGFTTPRRTFARTMVPLFDARLSDSDNEIPFTQEMQIKSRTVKFDGAPIVSPSPRLKRSTSRSSHQMPRTSVVVPTVQSNDNPILERAYRLDQLDDLSIEELESLLYTLKQERKALARDRRFKDGLRCNSAIEHVLKYLMKAQISLQQQQIIEESQEEDNFFRQSLKQFDDETKQKEQELIASQKQARSELKAAQKVELEELVQLWNSPVKRRMYNKPSQKLAELHRQMNICTKNSNFEEAESLRKEINQLRKEESEAAYQKMKTDFEQAQEVMEKKHKQDMALFTETSRVKMERFKQRRAKQRRAFEFHEKTMLKKNDETEKTDR